MKIQYYKFEKEQVNRIEEQVPASQWKEKLDWVTIKVADRTDLHSLLSELKISKEKREFIIHPDLYPLPVIESDIILQHIVVSSESDFYIPDYFTIIIMEDLIIGILPDPTSIYNEFTLSNKLRENYNDLRFYFLSMMVGDIIAMNIKNLTIARNRLREMEDKLMTEPEQLRSNEVMSTRSKMGHLADIVEDQHVAFGIMSTYFISNKFKNDIDKFNMLISRLEEINRMMSRLEEKAESLRIQFMLIQQEESTRKINILTIMQVIFVPMTFIAGVYGMNFANMPELNMKYAYFVIWGIFVFIAGTLLYFFKKNGWFDL
jgi:magnesium transporter